ncbi:hypothetical protein F2Q68_00012286 [Brassica cretica]|uniref:Uncharacterized protein n=1 Tax=Brassica cretica TaxID=69181 RepID=A0A8S9KMR9_BRACR|nr:hypothetical protein F2Q68_00012286 [Brassica cretica]
MLCCSDFDVYVVGKESRRHLEIIGNIAHEVVHIVLLIALPLPSRNCTSKIAYLNLPRCDPTSSVRYYGKTRELAQQIEKVMRALGGLDYLWRQGSC